MISVLLTTLLASNLPKLCLCLRPGTSLTDLCLPMTGWVAPACRNPVSGEERLDQCLSCCVIESHIAMHAVQRLHEGKWTNFAFMILFLYCLCHV